MTLYTGTRIGADGKRHPVDGCDIPEDSDAENRAVLPIFGLPTAGQVPVWNAARERLEWGAGGGGAGEEARLAAIELVNTNQDASITSLGGDVADIEPVLTALNVAVAAVNDIPGRVDDLETTRVSSATITTIVTVTQAAYDALSPPVASTLYVIVG